MTDTSASVLTQKVKRMDDKVVAMGGGLVGFVLNGGKHREVIEVADIRSIRQRTNGGTSIGLTGARCLLTSCVVDDVLEAVDAAQEGDADGTD